MGHPAPGNERRTCRSREWLSKKPPERCRTRDSVDLPRCDGALCRRFPLDVWYDHIELRDLFASSKAQNVDQHWPKLTDAKQPRFLDQPPLFRRIPLDVAESDKAKSIIDSYRTTLPNHVQVLLARFELRDLAQKVVGVGSVGTRCYVALLETDRGESLTLQVKEADASVLEAYAGASTYQQHGQRVVEGQRLMQAASDIFLGWTTNAGVAYYVRQLHDMKTSFPVTTMGLRDLTRYVRLCAWTLAHGHARSGNPQDIAKYLGRSSAFDVSAAAFATKYAELTEADYRLYCRTVTT